MSLDIAKRLGVGGILYYSLQIDKNSKLNDLGFLFLFFSFFFFLMAMKHVGS